VGCNYCRPAGKPEAAGDLPVSSKAAGSWLRSQLGEKLPAVGEKLWKLPLLLPSKPL